jgi:hypothetical protein
MGVGTQYPDTHTRDMIGTKIGFSDWDGIFFQAMSLSL